MAYTPDQVALAIIQEGQNARTSGSPETLHPAITPRGIQEALATAIVEANDQVLANPSDPASEALPNDGDGYDHASEGTFQQQAPWWGTVEERMDPALSAAMFYNHLAKLDYNGPNSPGSYAQDVQGSEFPDRYDQEWNAAVAQYNRLIGSVGSGAPVSDPVTTPTVLTPVNRPAFTETNLIDINPVSNNDEDRAPFSARLFVLHTEEGGMQGIDLATWMGNNSVSYHYVVNADGSVFDCVDTDEGSWSVLDPANQYTINLVFAGSYSGWSRQEWLVNMQTGIQSAAYIAVQDCLKYGIDIQVLVGNNYPKVVTESGITDHNAITVNRVALGIPGSTHTDVGPNFPWDVFWAYVQKFTPSDTAPPTTDPTEEDDMFSDADRAMLTRVYFELTNVWDSRSIYREPGEGPVDTLAGMVLNIDGASHPALVVEKLALLGDSDSLRRVIRSAAGDGAVSDAETVARAKAILAQVPAALLQAYDAAQATS